MPQRRRNAPALGRVTASITRATRRRSVMRAPPRRGAAPAHSRARRRRPTSRAGARRRGRARSRVRRLQRADLAQHAGNGRVALGHREIVRTYSSLTVAIISLRAGGQIAVRRDDAEALPALAGQDLPCDSDAHELRAARLATTTTFLPTRSARRVMLGDAREHRALLGGRATRAASTASGLRHRLGRQPPTATRRSIRWNSSM